MPRTSRPTKGVKVRTPTPSPAVVSPAVPSAGPGIMAQIATNAAGTALGHVVAHQIIGAPSGGTAVVKSCATEISALLQCGKENSDLNFCTDFLEKLRQCS
jgi:hypothetical protein